MHQANLISAAIGSSSDPIFARVIDFRSAPLRIYGQPQCASALADTGSEQQRSAGVGGEHHNQQQPRHPREYGGVPEPRGTALTHVVR
jgi:hypothetical protein